MSRRRWIATAAVLVVVIAGLWWWRSRAAGAAPKYRTAQVDQGSVESVVSATGTIRPVVQVEVGSQVSGIVQKLFADYNSRVKAGQIICQLEPSSFNARVVQSEASVARAAATARDGERSLARAQELKAKDYVSQAELDAAVVALEVRRADLKQARAELAAAQVDLEHTTIRAPIDGVVISRSIDLGQTVAASLQAPKLFVIANDLAQMQVETAIDEADIWQIRQGLPASFTVDAFPDRDFQGTVSQVRLEPITDQNVVTYVTVIRTQNPDGRLRPGMTANVTVKIERRDGVTRVPNAALRYRPSAGTGGGAGGGQGAGGGGRLAATAGVGRGAAQAATPGGGATGRGGRSGAWAGASDEQRAALRERMRILSPEERQRVRDSLMTASGGGSPELAKRGKAGADARGLQATTEPGGGPDPGPTYRPGAVYVLVNGKPSRVGLLTGITDGAFTEVRSDKLKPGDTLIVGMDAGPKSASLQPPPGMGGPGFRGGGGGRR
jgi:HlyD family secretion protein